MKVKLRCILVFITWTALIQGKMEPFVVGGHRADINQFPHSVFLSIRCFEEGSAELGSVDWVCGGSIVNQWIILTAAHCIYGCSRKSVLTASVGHAHNKKGGKATILTYYTHPKYNAVGTSNDIGLEKLKTPLTFGMNVKRIALMEHPPYDAKAQIAGWGMIDDNLNILANNLKHVDQYVWKTVACKEVIRRLPKGVICASSGDSKAYSSRGDSGSALVVRGYIQIGIVSYKMPAISKSLVIYTDTGYFYNWIVKNAKRLYCA